MPGSKLAALLKPMGRPFIRWLFIVFGCLGLMVAWRAYMFPFGHRSYTLRHLYAEMSYYASEHYGVFPDSDKGPYDALSKLYPKYSSAEELAGVSGDTGRTRAALRHGQLLSKETTSLVYVPGFAESDNSSIAILWESRAGVYANGRRNFFGGRAVLLINGYITNVPVVDWAKFLSHQEELRRSALAGRFRKSGPGNP